MDVLQLPTCTDDDGQEFDYALVVVCRLSGYVLAIPCLKRGFDRRENGVDVPASCGDDL